MQLCFPFCQQQVNFDSLLSKKKRLEEKVYELTKLLHQSQDESWNLKNKESERQRELRVLQSQFEETTRQCEEVPLHTCFQFQQKQTILSLQKDLNSMNMEKTTIQLQQTTLQQQVDVLVTLWMPFECRLLVSKIRKQPLLLLSPPSLRRVLCGVRIVTDSCKISQR